MSLGQTDAETIAYDPITGEAWMSVFAPGVAEEPVHEIVRPGILDAPVWGAEATPEERGPTAEVPWLYEIGPLGWHMWQWYALGAGALVVLLASGDGRRRR